HLDAHRKLGPDVVVIGPMRRPPDIDLQPWVDWEQAMLDKQYAAMEGGAWSATPRQFYTGNASLQRARLLDVGGFDCAFRRAEDVELAYRLDDAGMRFEYLSDAAGYHYAKRSFEAWRSMAYTYGRNDVIFARDRGRDWIFPFMAEKFGQHQAPLRWLISSTVRVPKAGAVLAPALRLLAMASDRVGLPAIARASYSCIYGIEYHGGIADELGSREAFFESVRTGTGPTSS
ncbi:MAG: glycosyltransferase family 2 protein, partial [Actinomycetota bacterium]